MTLSFSTKINGKPNYFIEKIWKGLVNGRNLWDTEYAVYSRSHLDLFGIPWSDFPLNLDRRIKPKLHTLRDDPHNRWRPGMDIHPVINNRTANRFQFAPVIKCVSVQTVEIIHNHYPFESTGEPKWTINAIIVDGKELAYQAVEQLAINDGFDSVEDFFAYFNTDCRKKLIHWTDLKY